MIKFLKEFLDWSEVWATLIPLVVYFLFKPKADWIYPLLVYLFISLLFYLVIDFNWKAKGLGLGNWSENIFHWLYVDVNGKQILYTLIFYNLNSFLRLLCLSWFFYRVNPLYRKIYFFITALFITGSIVNFIFFENIFFDFSSRLHTIEAAILLFYCLLYYYTVNMNDEIPSPLALPSFWIVMGLTLYTSVNFLIFLFYKFLIAEEHAYAIDIWNVQNLIYIVLMIFISAAFKQAK